MSRKGCFYEDLISPATIKPD